MAADKDTVQFAVDQLDRQIRQFAFERYISLAGAVIAFVLTIYSSYRLVQADVPDKETLAALCGANGVIAVALGFITRFFDKSFRLLDFLLRAMVATPPAPGAGNAERADG